VSGCFAYDDPEKGQLILLLVHQGLHIPHLICSLLPPFQLGENDVIVNDRPKFQTLHPTLDDHTLFVPQDDVMPYHIPLSLRVTTSFVDVRLPAKSEATDLDLMMLELTCQTPEWEPGFSSYADLEEKLLDDPAVGLSTEIAKKFVSSNIKCR
jgi:hypothetical protein